MTTASKYLCAVCRARPRRSGFLCRLCGRSYDEALRKDDTVLGAITWAANRARRSVMRELRAEDRGPGLDLARLVVKVPKS